MTDSVASVSSEIKTGRQEQENRAGRPVTRSLARPLAMSSISERLAWLVECAPAVYDLSLPADTYCNGVVTELERRVAELLGKEDAVFFPTGTMAQQIVLRCWAERTGNNAVALHALSHPEVFEADAFRRVSNLRPVRITGAPRPPTADEVRALPDPFGALMIELPLRDAGFLLPTWDELVDLTAAARDLGAIVHFDGARLWECTTHFERTLDQIAALADTVYVSFYKSLDGFSGAAVAGPRDVMETARTWRHRYGGLVVQQFPAALSAMVGLQRELPRLPDYVAQARVVASALAQGLRESGVSWFRVLPEVPHTHQLQVWLPFPAELLAKAAARQADENGVALFTPTWWEPGFPPGIAVTEVTASAAALEWTADDVRSAVSDFLAFVG